MTKNTFNLICKMNKKHLVDFIQRLENIPKIGIKSEDLTEEQILECEKLYQNLKIQSNSNNEYISNGEIECDYCGAKACYTYNDDEIEFEKNGRGHYFVDCHCRKCDTDFRKTFYFKYHLIK